MKKVYYRGEPFDCEIITLMNKRIYALYEQGSLKYYVKEEELDIRSRVSMILDSYYNSLSAQIPSKVVDGL